jgi:hypothetical protein
LEELELEGKLDSFVRQSRLLTILSYLALLVGRLGLTVPQLKEEFTQFIILIIPGSISSDTLDNFLKAVVAKYTGDSETLMYDPKSPTFHCKT